ncbi:MAG: glycoside hydrolase family 3 N-terminal domain-containing protein [Rikenellaceae bacterium]
MRQTLVSLIIITLISCNASPKSLSIEEKAAKLLIVGVIGNELTEGNPVIRDVKERGVSGVILFENNIAAEQSREKMQSFIAQMQALSPTPLFVAIDQEGGKVNRMKSKYGFEEMPSQAEVGASEGVEYALQTAQTIASEVASVGINLNFSPVLDLNINKTSPAIGAIGRSFSEDEMRVSELAKVYIEEHHKRNVATSLKHFPGHGSAKADSHLGLTDITNTWQRRELTPYRELIKEELCDMIMVSHLFNTSIDPDYPATLSRPTIEGLLRGELGWDGVVVSDDMQMRAITDNYGFEEAISLAINAGVDLFIISRRDNNSDVAGAFIEAVTNAVKAGIITEEQLDSSIKRIEALRKKWL